MNHAFPPWVGTDSSARSAGRSEMRRDRNKELKKRSDAQRLCFGTEKVAPSGDG